MAIERNYGQPPASLYGGWRSRSSPPLSFSFDHENEGYRLAAETAPTQLFSSLESALDIVMMDQTPNSIVAKLEHHPIDLACIGLVAENTGTIQEGPRLIQRLKTILTELDKPENNFVIYDWLAQNFLTPEYTQMVLRALAQFSSKVLDSASLTTMYKTSEGNVSLRALHRLRQVIADTSPTYHPVQSGSSTLEIFDSRFPNIKHSFVDECSEAEFQFCITPDINAVVTNLISFVDRNQSSNIDVATLTRSLIKYIELSGLPDSQQGSALSRFMDRFGNTQHGTVICDMLRKQAVDAYLIPDPAHGDIEAQLKRETIEAAIERQLVDFVDLNVSDLVGDAEIVEVLLLPGSFAPLHRGHQQNLIERVHAYISFLSEQEAEQGYPNGKTARIILGMPLTDQYGVNGHAKKPENIGDLARRIGVMGLSTSHLKDFQLTTQLQPIPREAGNIVTAINLTGDALFNKISSDFSDRGRFIDKGNIRIRVVVGADEYLKSDKHGSMDKLDQTYPNLIVGRSGYLLELIDKADTFTAQGATVIVVSGIVGPGSSESIRMLNDPKNHTPVALLSLVPYIRDHWGNDALEERKPRPLAPLERIPSVTEIMQSEIEQYGAVIQVESLL
jgi:hypothetical protein